MRDQLASSLGQSPESPRVSLVSWVLGASLAILSLFLVCGQSGIGHAGEQDAYPRSVSSVISQGDPGVVFSLRDEAGRTGCIPAPGQAMVATVESRTSAEGTATVGSPELQPCDTPLGNAPALGWEEPRDQVAAHLGDSAPPPLLPGQERQGEALATGAAVNQRESPALAGEAGLSQAEGSKEGTTKVREGPSLGHPSPQQSDIPSKADAPATPQGDASLTGEAPTVPLHPSESSMLEALNRNRAEMGLPQVIVDPALTSVARQRSHDMATHNYFSHTAPDGSTYLSLLQDRGVVSGTVGEILGRNNASDGLSVPMVLEAFLKSPPHRLHIAYASYQWIGVGASVGEGNMKYFTIIFRAPPEGP